MHTRHGPVAAAALTALLVSSLAGCPGRGQPSADPLPSPWPPVKGQPYPNLKLAEASGGQLELASLRGKVVLVEPIGIGCPACNAYAGAESLGGFRGAPVQEGLGALETHLRDLAHVRLGGEPDLVLVQLLLFDGSSSVGHAPTLEDAREWAEHFGFAGRPEVHVVCGTTALANQASYALVPGFQLIDRQGVLRYDGCGHHPQDNPYDVVLASIPALLGESP